MTVVTSVPLGSTVHDRAVVTGTSFGTPTGTCRSGGSRMVTCSGDGVAAGTVTLVSGVAHASDAESPATAGAFAFQATYEGDANYDASTGPCEPLTVTSVDLSITKTDGGAVPVAGDGTFTYTLTIDNLGPSDAQNDATVVDVLPAEITFASFGVVPVGVTCAPPVGQTITCTIAKELLEVSDDVVQIPIQVSVQAGTTVASITNKAIVSSPDDEAPCTRDIREHLVQPVGHQQLRPGRHAARRGCRRSPRAAPRPRPRRPRPPRPSRPPRLHRLRPGAARAPGRDARGHRRDLPVGAVATQGKVGRPFDLTSQLLHIVLRS